MWLRTLVAASPLIVIGAFATLFLGGDLGKFSDDYWFVNRDVVTGDVRPWGAFRSGMFRRPLQVPVVGALQTAFWFDDELNHFVVVLARAVCACGLAALLRRLWLNREASAVASLLFFVYPASYEVAFWEAGISIGLGALFFLVVCLLAIRAVRRPVGPGTLGGIFAASFTIPCFNEQPAAALGALPLLIAAATRSMPRFPWRRAVAVVVSAWAAGGLYLALFFSTIRPGQRGSPDRMVAVGGVVDRLVEFGERVWNLMSMADLGVASLQAGFTQLLARPVRTGAFAAALVASLVLSRAARREVGSAGDRGPGPAPSWVLAFGATVAVLTWLPPLLVAGSGAPSRLAHAPALGWAIVLAVLLDRAIRAGSTVRRTALASTVFVVGVFSVMLVGFQGLFHARAVADEQLSRQLVQLVPAPAPGTVFAVLHDGRAISQTGRPRFDGALPSPLWFPQSATPYVRWSYRRDDLFALQSRLVRHAGDDGVVLDFGRTPFPPIGHEHVGGDEWRVPWGSLIPISIKRDGHVMLAREVVVGRGSEKRVYRLPQAEALANVRPTRTQRVRLRVE